MEAQDELRDANQNLEHRIEERTRDLREAVARLEEEIDERERVERALEVEKQLVLATVYSMGEGVIKTDAEGCVRLMNPRAEVLTGWSREEALGRPIRDVVQTAGLEDVTPAGPEGAPELEDLLSGHAIASRRTEWRMRHRDGHELQVVETAATVHDPEGRVSGLVVVLRDVTSQRQMQAELHRNQRLESLGVLAGGIAHDFNNLLTVIQGNVTLALDVDIDDQNQRKVIEAAARGCEAAADLPRQLLALAKGGAPIKQRGASVVQLIHDVADFAMRGASVTCTVSIPEDLSPADIDQGQIAQALQNLVINARQAMPEGGEIRVRALNVTAAAVTDPPHGWIEIVVEDDGRGISEEDLQHIFDPYFTSKEEGSGLGLSTSYWIAKRHGGTLEATSELGVGTCFVLRLPASDLIEESEAVASPNAAPKSLRILVMDDEPSIRTFLLTALTSFGHTTVATASGQEALTAFSDALDAGEPFDVVFLDLTIPGGMGGAEALVGMRELSPDTRAVVMSGYSSDPILARYEEYGFQAKLPKPFTVTSLIGVLA